MNLLDNNLLYWRWCQTESYLRNVQLLVRNWLHRNINAALAVACRSIMCADISFKLHIHSLHAKDTVIHLFRHVVNVSFNKSERKQIQLLLCKRLTMHFWLFHDTTRIRIQSAYFMICVAPETKQHNYLAIIRSQDVFRPQVRISSFLTCTAWARACKSHTSHWFSYK